MFALVPSTFNITNKRDLHDALIFSRIAGGRVTESRVIQTQYGASVKMKRNTTWVSLRTIAKDIENITGLKLSRQNIRTSIARLERRGLIIARDALDAGMSGSIFRISDDALKGDLFDAVKEANVLIWGDPRKYTEGFLLRDVTNRRKYFSGVDRVIEDVALEGRHEELYASVGRWQRGDGGKDSASVFVPHITIDVDRNNMYDAWQDTLSMISYLEDYDIYSEYITVAISGGKGFHITMDSRLFGRMIFEDRDACASFLAALFDRIFDNEMLIDTSVFVATQPIRVLGSKHGKTGLYKVGWNAKDFSDLSLDDIMAQAKDPSPYTFPRYEGPVPAAIQEIVNEVERDVALGISQQVSYTPGGSEGPCITRALEGCGEQDRWYKNHTGRHKLIWILAMFYLERKSQKETWDILMEVNERNNPPLMEGSVRREFNKALRRLKLNREF